MTDIPDIPESLIEAMREFLGKEGIAQFREWRKEHGTVSPVLKTEIGQGVPPIPHPVHFREGMQIRNFMRGTGLCTGWDDHDYDNKWSKVVEAAIK
jgi:hypothetical protein